MSLRRTVFSSTIILVLTLIVVTCYLVIQNVGSVHQVFFPMVTSVVEAENNKESWESVSFNNKTAITFDSIFWDKDVTNNANSVGEMLLRVKDVYGNIVLDEFILKPGESIKLDKLKNDEKYFFEVKAPQGRIFLSAS